MSKPAPQTAGFLLSYCYGKENWHDPSEVGETASSVRFHTG